MVHTPALDGDRYLEYLFPMIKAHSQKDGLKNCLFAFPLTSSASTPEMVARSQRGCVIMETTGLISAIAVAVFIAFSASNADAGCRKVDDGQGGFLYSCDPIIGYEPGYRPSERAQRIGVLDDPPSQNVRREEFRRQRIEREQERAIPGGSQSLGLGLGCGLEMGKANCGLR